MSTPSVFSNLNIRCANRTILLSGYNNRWPLAKSKPGERSYVCYVSIPLQHMNPLNLLRVHACWRPPPSFPSSSIAIPPKSHPPLGFHVFFSLFSLSFLVLTSSSIIYGGCVCQLSGSKFSVSNRSLRWKSEHCSIGLFVVKIDYCMNVIKRILLAQKLQYGVNDLFNFGAHVFKFQLMI